MRESTRRQILADMGIVQWRLRVAEGAAARPAATPPAAVPPVEAAAAEPPASSPVAAEPEIAEPEAVAPWSALSLAAGGVVLIIDGERSQRDLRLAMDVLAAACGDWSGKPSSRRFDWPPGGAAGAAAGGVTASRRALAAFVDKEVTDHQARLLLCTEPLTELVPQPPAPCRRLVIAELDVLGRDAEAKQALWEALTGTSP